MLLLLVRKALNSTTVEIGDWHVAPIHGAGDTLAPRSLYRISGIGQDHASIIPWSLVLKVLRCLAGANDSDQEQRHCFYWKREALAYQSDLLDSLPEGLRAPRCFDVVEHLDNAVWIFLEDIHETTGPRWPLERYGLAARHLGRFNGIYRASRPLPSYSWLSQDWLRSRTDGLDTPQQLVQDTKTWKHPLVRRAFPIPIQERLLDLYRDREALLRALARLPQTLCHLDAWRGNLIACHSNGKDQTVAIDWAFVGHGAMGVEISLLVWVSLLEFEVEPDDAMRLEQSIVEGYLDGLKEVGISESPATVLFGCHVNAALLCCMLPDALTFALTESRHAEWEQEYGHPIAEIVERSAAVTYLLLERLDAAQKQV
jgi:hypothetical protein